VAASAKPRSGGRARSEKGLAENAVMLYRDDLQVFSGSLQSKERQFYFGFSPRDISLVFRAGVA
jgi:hypothetical protein